MIPVDIIKKYYQAGSELYEILLAHSFSVADKALYIAQLHPEMNLDKTFIYEAAILHDIGIFRTNAPDIYCFGTFPYICHGFLGSNLLKEEGLPRHALVCERHTGTGVSQADIIERNLPVPQRDMLPVSLEEQLICFADKFFSKTRLEKEKPMDKVRKGLSKHGKESVNRFDNWCKIFLG
ncbi:phosphohydrolase [Bacteroidia bacterium]|nr:phosphohydrolase [Bacteroidia bacterium]GHT28050.1 phosphohydrolase [Bacteroidia bacterium]GHV70249.1 phosphohydrolase [Bacteroidia bacterium]